MGTSYPPLLKRIATTASNLMPDFNDDLLLRFRQKTMQLGPAYIDQMLREQAQMLHSSVKYKGYRLLTPDERIQYIKENKILKKKINIQMSTFNLWAFIYEYQGIEYPIRISIPYLNADGAAVLEGTEYYPLFVLVEKGGLHRTHSKEVVIKVMRAPLSFTRDESYAFMTDKKRVIRCNLITVKLHQRKTTSKRNGRTPLLLYHLVQYGFQGTMNLYGFAPDEISLVESYPEKPEEEYSYIKVTKDDPIVRRRRKVTASEFTESPGIFLRVKDSCLNDKNKQRVIASFMACLDEYPRFEYRDLVAPHTIYYTTVLGKYTYPQNTDGRLLFDNAMKHLETTKTLLDQSAKYALSTIGINATDIYDLLRIVFFNIDEWVITYNPINMFEKKIAALERIMTPVVTNINTKLFSIINSRNEGFNEATIKKFTRSASQGEKWMTSNQMFRAKPSKYNDNWLMTIGTKRFRSLSNAEQGNSLGGKNIAKTLLKSHYSELQVESIMALPHSSPIISGEINPYCLIDEDGSILEDKELSAATEHCYD